jgi:ribosome recycling factor
MEEDIKMFLDEARDLMNKAVQHTQKEFVKIRAGKATPEMLNGIVVDYYGMMSPIGQVATVNTPDARTIAIKPFEKSMIQKIEKAIKDSDLGVQPNNDGELIRLTLPPLTEERRQKLAKQVKQEGEAGKVSVRNIRKDINNSLKELQKEGASEDAIKKAEEKVQKYTDEFIAKIDEIVTKKEAELMTV